MTNALYFLLWLVPVSVQSFTITTSAHHHAAFVRSSNTALASTSSSGTEEHLNNLANEFRKLEIELSDVKLTKDELAAANVAERMLEKAIDIVKVKQLLDEEYVSEASAQLAKATSEEEDVEESIKAIHENTEAADSQADMVETYDDTYEDLERRRDLSVAHASHQMELDLDDVLHTAQAVAVEAKKKLLEAKRDIQQLEVNERALKATLQELHDARMKAQE